MSRGGGKKGAEAGWGSVEKRGESIVILNRKYSGIKPKRGHKKGSSWREYDYCQWSNISIMGVKMVR